MRQYKINLWITRQLSQFLMGLFLIFTGWQFYRYVLYLQSGGRLTPVLKPAAAEGFLPISALLGVKKWLLTGTYDSIHPAGLSIFLIILLTAMLFNKGFCSWLCPIGALSEGLAKMGKRIMGRNFQPPRWLDSILMSTKYIFLFFFVYVIFIKMSLADVDAFLNSPYNKLADIKMLTFFTEMSKTTAAVLIIIGLFSLFIKLFWCRYLCPYGALQGLISLLSPIKIVRNEKKCTGCGSCNRNCPAMIKISNKQRITSPECSNCFNCLSACPIDHCLSVGISKNIQIRPEVYAIMFLGSFFFLILYAKLSGHWESSLKTADLYYLVKQLASVQHP